MMPRKLTPALLRKIVLEEKTKLVREAAAKSKAKSKDPIAAGLAHPSDLEAPEVDADGYANTLANDIDYMKALKIQERRLAAKLRSIQEAKRRIRNRVTKQLS